MVNKETEVIYIPAKLGRVLNDSVKYYMLAIVPKKRLVKEADLLEFLARKLKVEWINFKRDTQDYCQNWEFFEGKDCSYKLVSSVGNVSNVHKEKLLSEGFELTPSTKSLCKIKDFKKYLFDYDIETNVDASLIEFVNKRGITTLSNLVINK